MCFGVDNVLKFVHYTIYKRGDFCYNKIMEQVDTTSPDGERNMGSELDHFIFCEDKCPNCGRRYRICGDVYEYPIGTLSLDQTKIEWKNSKENK